MEIHDACKAGNAERVRGLLGANPELTRAETDDGSMPLHYAANKEVAELLITRGADLNAKSGGPLEWTPVHYAVARGSADVLELLIAKGADVCERDEHGLTPLHIAVMVGRKQMGLMLMAAGADVDARSNRGNTPLHAAVRRGDKELSAALVTRGADVNAENDNGWKPLNYAGGSFQDLADMLRCHGRY
ncbi:unnamed protein product [marine sediment metagenome]|uniref:Uncharacterized protein n=1 Tax=marine sediment metagenome TaxID=412755 RepID=X1P0X7_9ZZZZ